jgi:hypothetical protein
MIDNMKECLDKYDDILYRYNSKIILDKPKYIDSIWTDFINDLRMLGMNESTIELLPKSLDYNNGISGSIGEYIANYDDLEEIYNYFIVMSETLYYTKEYIWRTLNNIYTDDSINDISVAVKIMIIYKELTNMREVSILINHLKAICTKHKIGIFKYDSI